METDQAPSADGGSILPQLAPLLLLTGIFFFNFSSRIVFAPLLPEIEADLRISHASAGSLFLVLTAGYFLGLICSGWIASRINHRWTIVSSSIALGIAVIASTFGNSLWLLRLLLFLTGSVAAMYIPSGIATLTSLVHPRHWGKAIAIHELAPNLAFLTTPIFAELVLSRMSWRAAPAMTGMAAIVLGIAFAVGGRGGKSKGMAPSLASFKAFLGLPEFWMIVALFGIGISATMGIYTMLPLYLVNDHGLDRNLANTLVSLSRVAAVATAFIGGWACDRFGPAKTIAGVFTLTSVATLAMSLTKGPWMLTAFFLQPLAAVCFFPAGFAALSGIGPQESRNIAVSLTAPLGFMLGGGIIPVLIGYLGDTLSFSAGIGFVGVMALTGVFLARRLDARLKRKKAGPD